MAEGRRIRGEGSIYQRESDGRWVGVVDLGWVGGKRVRKTVTASTLRELRPKFRALKERVARGVLTDESTVESWLRYWLAEVAPSRCRPRTLDGYRTYVDHYLIPHLGKRRLDKLAPEHVRAMQRAMADAGLSDATRRQAHYILRRALKVAAREGKVTRNVAELVDPPPVGTVHHTPLTLPQARAVLGSLDGDPLAARWVCALLLGMRQGECLGLQWEDVDMGERRIYVRRELVRLRGKGMTLAPPKSKTSRRSLPMIEPVAFALARTERRGPYVFYGQARDSRADWGEWKALLVRAGVCPEDAALGSMPALHAARATTASLLDEAGVSDKLIAEILGHSSVQITRTAYIQGNEDRHRAGLESLASMVIDTPPILMPGGTKGAGA